MVKRNLFYLFLALVLIVLGTAFLFLKNPASQSNNQYPQNTQTPEKNQPPTKISLASFDRNYFGKINLNNIYTPPKPRIKDYEFPLDLSKIKNFNQVKKNFPLSEKAKNYLSKHGFVVLSWHNKDQIAETYKDLDNLNLPIFITSDSLLHYYHIQFDESLKRVEENRLYYFVWQMANSLFKKTYNEFKNSQGIKKEAAKRNLAFLSVALELLKPKPSQICQPKNKYDNSCQNKENFQKQDLDNLSFKIPEAIKDQVDKEIFLINKHQGFKQSPIFIYLEDYSQYIPRGHYERSEKLKNYFKTMVWFGRMAMLLKGDKAIAKGKSCQSCKALISEYDAKIQTLQALELSNYFKTDKNLTDLWQKVYLTTAFYSGFADDLTFYDYLKASQKVFANDDLEKIDNSEKFLKFKAELLKLPKPKIYGGTGNAVLFLEENEPIDSLSKKVDKLLEKTMGFRLMGQRFVPDSYFFSELTNRVYNYTGPKKCSEVFSCIVSDVGEIRGFPRGLDVMALLGSKKAQDWLDILYDNSYRGYDNIYSKLSKEISALKEKDWKKNLYWAWLDTLKALLKKFPDGYPQFMLSYDWLDKELNTALSSWAELRHDTILYAKQSYTAIKATSVLPPANQILPKGYVEPLPEFYHKLANLIEITKIGLGKNGLNIIDKTQNENLKNLKNICQELEKISKKELEDEALSEQEYEFIKSFGQTLENVAQDIDKQALKTTIIADVHTDANTKQVLEEGIGYVKALLVAYKIPAENKITIGIGPVFSYYEFKQPMAKRLTDKNWQEILKTKVLDLPIWEKNYTY